MALASYFMLNSKPCSVSNIIFKLTSPSTKAFAHPQGKDPPGPLSSARTQLDLLEQLSSTSSAADGYPNLTIREQLAGLVGDRDDDFSIPLGKNLKKVGPKFLTISQKRNIRRQAYLNEVSKRDDSVFFATIGAFVLVPRGGHGRLTVPF